MKKHSKFFFFFLVLLFFPALCKASTIVLSSISPNHTITAGSDDQVYGTSASNQIFLESNAKAELLNFPGQNYIQIQTGSNQFTVSRSGSLVTFQGADGTFLKIPATGTCQLVSFNGEESKILQIHDKKVMLDDQVIATKPASIEVNQADASNALHWYEAHNHIGEHVTVEGIFKYTNNIGKICFLNFHPNFNQYVSVLIFQDYFSLFPENPEIYYYSKRVKVHGKITEFKGKAQIKVYDPKQIEIIGEYERKEPHKEYQCNYPNQLEITAINIGQGDATLIATPSKIVLADVGESFWYSNADALKVDDVIRSKYGSNCRKIDYVINSHFHLDHIGYIYLPEMAGDLPINSKMDILKIGESPYKPLAYGGLAWLVLEEGYKIGQLLVRDYHNHNPNKSPQDGGSKTFRNWKIVLESNEGKEWFNPKIMTFEDSPLEIDRIGTMPVIIDIIALDGATPSNPDGCDPEIYFGGKNFTIRGDRSKDKLPPSENDLCLSFILSFGEFQMFIGGDLSGENYESEFGYRYHNVEECLSNDLYFLKKYGRKIEVLKANHHGSSHSCNLNFFKTINPIATIFSVGDHNNYGHVDNDVLDRASKFSEVVYLTECGDNIRSENDAVSKGVIVVDGEYPDELEENEIGDTNIEIIVAHDGKSFNLQGIQHLVH